MRTRNQLLALLEQFGENIIAIDTDTRQIVHWTDKKDEIAIHTYSADLGRGEMVLMGGDYFKCIGDVYDEVMERYHKRIDDRRKDYAISA